VNVSDTTFLLSGGKDCTQWSIYKYREAVYELTVSER